MHFTRRQWMGAGAAGMFGAMAYGLKLSPIAQALAATELDANAQLAALKSFSGVVPHATHYGPLLATVEKGRIVKIEAQASDKMPTAMLTEGVLDRTYDKTRVVGAMVRKSYLEWEQNGRKGSNKPELRGKDEWVQVSWDTALGLTAKAILDTIEKYGNEGCFSSSYGGWSHAGIFRPNVLQGRFFNLLGGSSVTTGDYSAGAGQILLPMVIGDMEVYSPQTAWEQLRDNTELVVFIGCDPDKNNRIEYTVCDHEMYSGWDAIKQAGCQFISINPQVTTTDEKMGSEWVRIVPNTDTALFMAMGYHLLSQNKHNQAFIDKYTVGFDKYRAHLEGKDGSAPKTPEWAEKITGIPAAKIRALAELMASKRTQLCASWAIQRAHHGEMPYWAIVNFACILGNIGLPGQGVGFSWHYGGGGTAQSGGTAPTGMSQGRNPVKKICPASRISEMLLNPGKEFTYNGSTYTFPQVKLIYNAGNNVFSHQQDLNELARAMQNVDTVICHEPWWNGSARWADIVLGATTTLERNDISSAGTYSIDKVYAMKQVVAPQHDALDDFEIFRRLAELFGVEYAFTEGKTPMDYVKDAYAASTASKHTPFDKFWADGMARIPVPPEAHKWVRHGDFRADPEKNPLHTHSGKVEMYSTTIAKMAIPDMPPMPTWQEPGEYLGNAKKGQVHVVSPHPYWRLHSQLNNSEKLRKRYTVQTREPLTISVQDAKANGIRDGDLVELHNARGALVVGARVSDKIMPGVVSLYEGAWPQLDSKGRCNNGLVNFLTSSRGSSGLTQATTANTCIASIRKCTDADPGGTKAFDPPKITKSDIKFDDAFFQLDRASVLREKATASLSPAEKIYYQRCSVCHGPRDPGQFTEKQWLGITPSMFQRAGLNDDEQKIVLDFLLKNAKH